MRIAVHGTGYPGLGTGACIAQAGNHVVGVEVDDATVESTSSPSAHPRTRTARPICATS